MIVTYESHVYVMSSLCVRVQVGCVDSIVDIVTASVLVDFIGPDDVRHVFTHTHRQRERERER